MRSILSLRPCFAFALVAGIPVASVLAHVEPSDTGVELQSIATGLVAPNLVTFAPDGSNRLFIVDQSGQIRIVQNGALLPTPFLDVSSLLPTLNPGFDERGLLGLAFHPQYATNGRFFIRHSIPRVGGPTEPCTPGSRGCHSEVLAEYTVSANPNVANPTAVRVLLTVEKPQFNHNSGMVEFGPDGFLYFTLGDGGGANDGLADTPPSHGPNGNAQPLNVMLGKLHRIDVNSATLPYGIPATNPFIATPGARPEIYANGLRNPFRFSFDSFPGGDNRLWLPDVGQNLTEEINIGASGANYGWPIKEGDKCFDPFNPTTLPPDSFCAGRTAGLTDPITDYRHVQGGEPIGISIIGGYVYRGAAIPELNAKYVFADFSTAFAAPDGHLFYCGVTNSHSVSRIRIGRDNRPLGAFVKGMGRDAAGDIYVCTGTSGGPNPNPAPNGVVWKLVPAPCQGDLDDGSGNGVHDNAVTIDDLVYMLVNFEAGNVAVDIDNGLSNGTRDQAVTIDDLLYFLKHFDAGC